MKVAVIGVGGMGFTHVKALKALSETMDVQVVAIADLVYKLAAAQLLIVEHHLQDDDAEGKLFDQLQSF